MHLRSSAIFAFLIVFALSWTCPAVRAGQTRVHRRHHSAVLTVDSHTTSHVKHHHKRHPDSIVEAPAASRKHLSRHAQLLARLRQEDVLLYQLRHERNAYAQRIAELSNIVHSTSAAKARRKERLAAMLAWKKHLHNLQASSHKSGGGHAENMASKSHSPRSAHALALAKHSATEQAHLQRLAVIQAREAKLWTQHLERLAEIEAQRQKHADNASRAVHIASDSGLPVWRGDAYAAQVPVKVVTVNLNDPRIRVSALLARNGIGTSEPFAHMIDRTHPYVAVTGTFFSLDNLKPVGDIVINGSLAYFGGMGTALAIKPNNHADMITVPWGRHHDWSGYDTVVACGPRLLEDGQIVLDPRMEHFGDRHMLAPNSRIAVGITGHNQLVFCMTRDAIYLGRLAKIMRSLGCVQAMNLDAGTSTGFYCNGDMMARPGRWLTNAIVVYTNGRQRHIAEVPSSSAEAATRWAAAKSSANPSHGAGTRIQLALLADNR